MAPELVIELMAERSRSQSKSPVQGPYRFHPSRGGRIEENASSRIANPESDFNSRIILMLLFFQIYRKRLTFVQ